MAYVPRELFGGALVADLPDGYLDASNLRQVPDHQEVFLSPTTLTSIVVELNEFVAAEQTADETFLSQGASPFAGANNGTRTFNEDQRAIIYHLNDVIASEGPNSPQLRSLSAIVPVTIGNAELVKQARAWEVTARVDTPVSKAQTQPRNMEEALTGAREPRHEATTIDFLLIRIPRHQTDLCVQINVPWKELLLPEGQNHNERAEGRSENLLAGVKQEEDRAEECLQRIARTIEIKDWGLFGDG